jgi:hypothetical protein
MLIRAAAVTGPGGTPLIGVHGHQAALREQPGDLGMDASGRLLGEHLVHAGIY